MVPLVARGGVALGGLECVWVGAWLAGHLLSWHLSWHLLAWHLLTCHLLSWHLLTWCLREELLLLPGREAAVGLYGGRHLGSSVRRCVCLRLPLDLLHPALGVVGRLRRWHGLHGLPLPLPLALTLTLPLHLILCVPVARILAVRLKVDPRRRRSHGLHRATLGWIHIRRDPGGVVGVGLVGHSGLAVGLRLGLVHGWLAVGVGLRGRGVLLRSLVRLLLMVARPLP